MKRVVVLFSVVVLIVLSLPIVATGVDPGCVNGDCPSNPGCTDGGCTSGDDSYKAGCCCAEPAALPDIRICCCKSDMVVQCRESYGPTHIFLNETRICMGQLPSDRVGSTSGPCGTDKMSTCAPDWFPSREHGAWWPTDLECGWMNQIDKCAQP